MGLISEHESGHAILALCGNIEVFKIAIGEHRSIPRSGGYIVYGAGGSRWSRCVAELGGQASEYVFLRSPSPHQGETPDHIQALATASQITGRGGDVDAVIAVLAEASSCAVELVRRNRSLILCLAAELDRAGALTGPEIAKIVGRIEPGPSRAEWQAECRWRQQQVAQILEARSSEQPATEESRRDARIRAIIDRRVLA